MVHEIASMEGQKDHLCTISQVCQGQNRKYAKTKQDQIASMLTSNRKYGKTKSQVFQNEIASMPPCVFDIFASMPYDKIASMKSK